jgi:hypothetical protein
MIPRAMSLDPKIGDRPHFRGQWSPPSSRARSRRNQLRRVVIDAKAREIHYEAPLAIIVRAAMLPEHGGGSNCMRATWPTFSTRFSAVIMKLDAAAQISAFGKFETRDFRLREKPSTEEVGICR